MNTNQTVRRYGFVDVPQSEPEFKEHSLGTYTTFRDYDAMRVVAEESAKAIARLEAKVRKLREALERIMGFRTSAFGDQTAVEMVRIAAAALNSTAGGKETR